MTGRSIGSIRQEVNGIAERWQRSAHALEAEDQPEGEQLARLVKTHSSDSFYGCDEPLEAAIFSILAELQKELDRIQAGAAKDRDVDR